MTISILSETKVFKGKFRFYYLPDDKYVGQRIALEKYEPYETRLMLGQAKKGDVVVDIGANIGFDSILLASKVGSKGKVYAFEPDPINFSILKKNIKANKMKNIIAIRLAVSDKNGISHLFKSEENYGDHRIYQSDSHEKKNKIKTIKLDNFIKEKVNLIKIDTQGWEPKVIMGAKKIIERDKPIIFFEYWPEGMKEAKLNAKWMMQFLEKIYKKIFLINDELNIYNSKSKKQIDIYCEKQKSGYADLWVKKDIKLQDKFNQFKNIKIKKLIKKMIGIL